MKPPRLTKAVVEAARKVGHTDDCATHHCLDCGTKKEVHDSRTEPCNCIVAKVAALDAAPEVEPRGWICESGHLVQPYRVKGLRCRLHLRAGIGSRECGGTLRRLVVAPEVE